MYEIISKYKVKKLNNYKSFKQYKLDDKNIFTKELYDKLEKYNDIFLIVSQSELLGIFVMKEDKFELNHDKKKCIKIDYLYILEKYRLYGLATEVINDVVRVMKNFRVGIKYLLVDTYVDSSMFFLNNGFDYYKSRKSKDKTCNIITFYKRIYE